MMEEIEELKFKQDVKTGLTYFDQVKNIVNKGEQEVKQLKKDYEDNVNKLIFIAKECNNEEILKKIDFIKHTSEEKPAPIEQ